MKHGEAGDKKVNVCVIMCCVCYVCVCLQLSDLEDKVRRFQLQIISAPGDHVEETAKEMVLLGTFLIGDRHWSSLISERIYITCNNNIIIIYSTLYSLHNLKTLSI